MLNKNPDDPQRAFTQILKCAKPLWQRFYASAQNQTAKGLVFASNDIAYKTDLSFNNINNKLYLEIRFTPQTDDESISQRVQAIQGRHSELLTTINFEQESHFIRLRAKSALSPLSIPSYEVKILFEDLRSILDDDDFQQLIN